MVITPNNKLVYCVQCFFTYVGVFLAVIPAKAGIHVPLFLKTMDSRLGESLPHSGGFAEEKRRPDYYLGNGDKCFFSRASIVKEFMQHSLEKEATE